LRAAGLHASDAINGNVGGVLGLPAQRRGLSRLNGIGIGAEGGGGGGRRWGGGGGGGGGGAAACFFLHAPRASTAARVIMRAQYFILRCFTSSSSMRARSRACRLHPKARNSGASLGAPAITTYWGAKPVRVRFLL